MFRKQYLKNKRNFDSARNHTVTEEYRHAKKFLT